MRGVYSGAAKAILFSDFSYERIYCGYSFEFK